MQVRRLMAAADYTVLPDIMQEDGFRELFLKSPIGRMIVEMHEDGHFVLAEVNDAAAAYFDMPRVRMMGCAPEDVMDVGAASEMKTLMATCFKTGKPAMFNALPRFPGGVKVQSFILTPIFDSMGQPRCIDVLARPELVDSAQLQRERDDAMMMMTSIFDTSGLGIMVLDHHGRVMRINDTFMSDYGWQREDLLGEEFTLLVSPEDRESSQRMYQDMIDARRSGTREMQIIRKDGMVADILVTMAIMELSQKRPFMVVTLRDMTERHNMMRNLEDAKEEADAANKAKSAFLANMSHELRTPLNAIIGFTEMMKKGTFGPIENGKYQEYLGDIHLSARHLLDIINDVLDMSKIEAGRVDLIESDVSITETLESVMRIMGERAHAAGVMLDFRVEDDVPAVRADQRLLRQILINLVSNAVKFTGAGHKVLVHAFNLPDGHVRVIVEDEGCGIPHDMLEHVMVPFGQVKDPRQSSGQGTGLGLPLARAMAELHDGKLEVQSTEGKGTTVLLDLPVQRKTGKR
ncbi:MAG: ATP-binding protein [Alphaproteobacteria bacterium]|nr:ATP-binding protein [Alphaproteobacteria bacterium]